ncbi:MAG: GNAT family N-acetyltransferase [Acidocella sp.]|uniref:GNAT family N-acetyltransferase n=1 Tax=Acidocella sp. TaxID=50710 RepID=UPI003FC18648
MNFTIRATTPGDAEAIASLRNMPGVRPNILALPFESVARSRAYIAATGPEKTSLVACAGERVIGTASLIRAKAPRRAHAAELGIMVADDHQGKGVGTALFAALIDLADNWLNLHRLELGVYADNAPALALYRKFGFEVEAHERQDAFRAGAYADSCLMARIRPGLTPDTSTPPPPSAPAPDLPWHLRAAEPGDLEGITAILNQPIVRHYTLRPPFSDPELNRHLAEPPEEFKVIVAVAGDTICGVAALTMGKRRQAHTGDIALLAVHDAWARRGIGRALLGALLDIADNWLNLRRLTLNVLADNDTAIPLYAAHGFVVEGRKRADVFRQGAFADTLAMARLR